MDTEERNEAQRDETAREFNGEELNPNESGNEGLTIILGLVRMPARLEPNYPKEFLKPNYRKVLSAKERNLIERYLWIIDCNLDEC